MSDYNEIKALAKILDRAADRAANITRPASGKQCFYIASLCFKNNVELEDIGMGIAQTNAILSSKAASNIIGNLLA